MALTDKTVLVTGGGRGVGREIALAFAQAGANVVVNYLQDTEAAHATAEACAEIGADVVAVQADVRDSAAIDEMIDRTVEAFGSIDIVVNNAGALTMPDGKPLRGPLTATCDEAVRTLIDSHLVGTINTSRAALRHMEPQGSGVIINVSSSATQRALPGHAVYAAAKAGVEGFTRALAYDAARKGVRVNCVRFGLLDSPSNAGLTADEGALQVYVKRFQPAGRLGDMGEAAAACLFLASDAAAYCIGEVLTLDGGSGL